MASRLVLALILLSQTAPALARGAASVPEGSNLTLFALGVLGVIIGRKFSMRRRDSD